MASNEKAVRGVVERNVYHEQVEEEKTARDIVYSFSSSKTTRRAASIWIASWVLAVGCRDR